ncbi:MAG: EAL domain-containing protein [Tepidisphaerales bacterium]
MSRNEPPPDTVALHPLGEAVAEGVETAAQLHALRQIGCDAVQGFGLGRPMPALQVGGHLQRVARGEHLALWRAAGQSSGASEVALATSV